MKRRAEESDHCRRQQRRDKMRCGQARHDQTGRYRKRRAGDCGNVRCGVCHCAKYPKRTPSRQETVAAQDEEE